MAFNLPLAPLDATTWSAQSPAAVLADVNNFLAFLGETLTKFSAGWVDDQT